MYLRARMNYKQPALSFSGPAILAMRGGGGGERVRSINSQVPRRTAASLFMTIDFAKHQAARGYRAPARRRGWRDRAFFFPSFHSSLPQTHSGPGEEPRCPRLSRSRDFARIIVGIDRRTVANLGNARFATTRACMETSRDAGRSLRYARERW